MVSQCANPECRRELHYLRNGKIYPFEVPVKGGGRRTEYYWLCGECSRRMVLTFANQSEVKIVLQARVCIKTDGFTDPGRDGMME